MIATRMLRATPDLVLLLPQPSRPVSRKQMPYTARMKNPIRSLGVGLLAALLCPLLAHAEFPDRTVKIVVPFDAGGSIDTVARALAQRLNDKWTVPVIVENRPGAALATAFAPMVLPAPGRFSTITGTFHLSFRRCASARATVSMLPPASNGTTILTVRTGNSA